MPFPLSRLLPALAVATILLAACAGDSSTAIVTGKETRDGAYCVRYTVEGVADEFCESPPRTLSVALSGPDCYREAVIGKPLPDSCK